MLNALSKLSPPPTYLMMPCVGVDISDTSLKYLAFEPTTLNKTEKKIKFWGDITIPDGVLERGMVIDPQQLTVALKELKQKTKAEFIRVSLPEERAYLFETEIRHNTPMKEVRNLLEFKLEENVPIPSREVFFDYHILPEESEGKKVKVVVAAYAKETILKYYDSCVAAGLRPVSFEVEAQAMARSVIPQDAAGAVMLVDFGNTRTGIGIAYKGVLLYTSTIDIGGKQLSQAMRKVLGEETAESELTHLKNTQGLVRGVDSSQVYDTLLSTVSVVKDELATRMQYWHMRGNDMGNRRINSIVLGGGSANLKGLPAYMTETLGVPCVRGNVWENTFSLATTIPPIDKRHSYGYATAIGLALKTTV